VSHCAFLRSIKNGFFEVKTIIGEKKSEKNLRKTTKQYAEGEI
jgi:hypothetical protein